MKLAISEHFYSLQGEGKTMGKPSVFLRLTACNLMCGGRGTEKDKKLHNGATWRCDSIEVWRTGRNLPIEEVVAELMAYEKDFYNGAHLIITGGEPLLQQKALEPFIETLVDMLGYKPFIEIETNGTITPKGKLFTYIDLFNCSPKLSNSGEELKRRYKPDTLNFLNLTRSIFKFVVSNEKDLQEVLLIVDKCNIFPNKVYLMPSASDIKELEGNTPQTVEWCLKQGFNFSTRLQIIIWNQTTGV
tara:strand:- start:30308 stop:31042 length:735 start_codon:yes stop_codon:yes gene_type:complete